MAGQIQGQVKINGQPAERRVVAVSYDAFTVAGSSPPVQRRQVVGEAVSDPVTGAYTVAMDYTGPVVLLGLDEWGQEWTPGHDYVVGERVRPTSGKETGFVYHCISPGIGSATEPEWWTDAGGTTGQDGAATLEARPFWQPVAQGPIVPELVGDFDPYWDKVVALLRFDEPNGSTSFLDQTGRNWSVEGSEIFADESQFKNGSGSLSVSGRDSGLYVPAGLLGNNDKFTMECWARRPGDMAGVSGMPTLLSQDGAGSARDQVLGITNDTGFWRLRFIRMSNLSAPVDLGASVEFAADTWHHVELSWDGGKMRLFLDGALVESADISIGWLNTGYPFRIARHFNPSYSQYRAGWNGWIDGVRITKGVVRHTDNFAPPAGPYPYPNQ